ncbi:MAG: hypothetical protein AAB733_01720 [Patescibacteria group bacterium]
MPFTPYHFGPSAAVALPLRKHLDVPVFVLANVLIDLEPLIMMTFGIPGSLHPFFHTLIGGVLGGLLWGWLAFQLRGFFSIIMRFFKLEYAPKLKTMLLSGVLGFWFHVFVDAFMHADLKPFFPFAWNPLYQLINTGSLYALTELFFLVALGIYAMIIHVQKRIKKNHD